MAQPPTVVGMGIVESNAGCACGAPGAEQEFGTHTSLRQVKIVWRTDPATSISRELARYWLERDRVKSDYNSESFKGDIQTHGIITAEGIHYPKDGHSFFAALDIAFTQSSFISVETITKPTEPQTSATKAHHSGNSGANPRSRSTHKSKHTRDRILGNRHKSGRGRS